MKLNELSINSRQIVSVLVTNVEEKTARNGSSYCTLTLSDGEQQVNANMWDKTQESLSIYVNHVVRALITVSSYKGAASYTIGSLQPDPSADIKDFILAAPLNSSEMYKAILDMIPQSELKMIVVALYKKYKDQLLYWAAAKTVHHNYYGGLLYHVYRMMQTAVAMKEVYPVDEDLLLCGVALHDIGKLAEISTNQLGTADYTVDGNLFGHLYMGGQMIQKTAEELGISGEKTKLLIHMIVSHHGSPEYGTITRPCIPEAMLLHHIDAMDAKMFQFETVGKTLEPGTVSDPVFSMDGVRVYKPCE